jgi:hypothetical protein
MVKLSHLETDYHIWANDKKLLISIDMGSKNLNLKCTCMDEYEDLLNMLFQIGWYWEQGVLPATL